MANGIQAAAATPSHSGLILSLIDRYASPSADMWDYANGAWLETTKIPSDHSEWGVNELINERIQSALKGLAQTAVADKNAPRQSPSYFVGRFYKSAIDENEIQNGGYQPLLPELARIDQVDTTSGLLAEVARLHRLQVNVLFNFAPEQDPGESDNEIASLAQGGLGLPEEGYYSRTDSQTSSTRTAYSNYIAAIFGDLGNTPAQSTANASTVMSIETKLASFSKTPDDLRDPIANYHRMTLSHLESLTPGIDWQNYFNNLGLPRPGLIDVNQPTFFLSLDSTLSSFTLGQWRTYLTWCLVNTEASRLSHNFDDANFSFYGKMLNGTPEQEPRWKRAIEATDGEIGDALGQLYVRKYFPPSAKARAVALVQNLKSVLRSDIASLTWMSTTTRAAALRKIDAMSIKVGYPDHWRDYSLLNLDSKSYVVNCMNADQLQFEHYLNKIGKPVDRTEWEMTAPTNNAYYDPANNSINFPAGILQPPFFSVTYDDSVNYGEIGATIGHEMTHGFDDQGRLFDGRGNLHNWWTPSDLANFNRRKSGIVRQYSSYEPLPGQHIDGNLTIGENIADIGGLKIAYLAYERSLKSKPRRNIDGYTPEQRFFIAYAQSWLEKERPELIELYLNTDPHSPPKYRVVGVLADTPEFYLAFPGPKGVAGSPTTIW